MKPVTVHLSEEDYKAFQAYAAKNDTTAASMIREAMAEYKVRHMKQRHSLKDHKPIETSGTVKPIGPDDDLLGEMIDAARS